MFVVGNLDNKARCKVRVNDLPFSNVLDIFRAISMTLCNLDTFENVKCEIIRSNTLFIAL